MIATVIAKVLSYKAKLIELIRHPAATLPVASIAVTFFVAQLGYILWQNQFPHPWFAIWNRWDTAHYMAIADQGYPAAGPQTFLICFLPLLPALMRFFNLFTGDSLLSGLIIANAAYLHACYFLYRLIRLDHSRAVARRGVVLMSIFPSAYFFHAAYTESLFLALTLAAFYYARQNKWGLSTTLGTLSTLCRLPGIASIPAIAYEYYAASKAQQKPLLRREALWLAILPLGVLIFLFINWKVFGNPLAFHELQISKFQKHVAWPWQGFRGAWLTWVNSSPSYGLFIGLYEAVAGLVLSILALYLLWRGRFSYAIYTLASAAMITVQSFWISNPRYLLGVFPFFIVLAGLCRNRYLYATLCLAGTMTYAFGLLRFVTQQWAL